MFDDNPPDSVFDLGLGFFGAKALHAAVELGVFAELADEPLDAETLAVRTGIESHGARDFFDALVASDLLEREDGVYRNATPADQYLVPSKPTYVGSFFQLTSVRTYRAWAGLAEGLRTGEPQAPVRSEQREGAFDTLFEDDQRLDLFVDGMSGMSAVSAVEIAETFPWSEYDSVCDLGTSQGKFPIEVARRNDHVDAVGFDLPPVESRFRENVAEHPFSDRISYHAGDFFEDSLPDADVYVLGHVLHNWDLDAKRRLLKKAYESLPEDGALVVYGTIIDDDRRENALALLMSLSMTIVMDGGQGYTFAECEGWLRDAGFAETRRVDLAGPDSMIVAEK